MVPIRLSTPNLTGGISTNPATSGVNARSSGTARPTATATLAAAEEEPLDPVHVGLGDQQVPADPLDQPAAAQPPGVVGNEGTAELSQRAHDDDQDDVEVALVSQHTPEEERDLGRDRHAAGLEEAEQGQGRVARMDEKVLHGSLLYRIVPGAPDKNGTPGRIGPAPGNRPPSPGDTGGAARLMAGGLGGGP